MGSAQSRGTRSPDVRRGEAANGGGLRLARLPIANDEAANEGGL